MWFAIYDKQINYTKLEEDHSLYKIGMNGECFNSYVFWRWYIYAFVMSIILIVYSITNLSTTITLDYNALDLWCLGNISLLLFIGSIIYSNIVFVVNLKLALLTNTHTIISTSLFMFSLVSYILILFGASQLKFFAVVGVWDVICQAPTVILAMLFIITVCLLCEYAFISITHIVEEIIIKPVKSMVFPKDKSVSYKKGDEKMYGFQRRCNL